MSVPGFLISFDNAPPYCTLYTWLAATHHDHSVTDSCKNITGYDMDSAVKETEEAIKEHCKEVNNELENVTTLILNLNLT